MSDYTDFYSQVKNGLILRLRYALKTDFFPNADGIERVSDNENNIQRGGDHYVVLKPGPFPPVDGQDYNSKEIQTVDWHTRVEIYVRFLQKDESWARFDPFRSAVIWHLMKYRFMGAVTIAGEAVPEVPNVDKVRSVSAFSEATYWRFFNTPPTAIPNFMFQPLNVIVRQRVRFS